DDAERERRRANVSMNQELPAMRQRLSQRQDRARSRRLVLPSMRRERWRAVRAETQRQGPRAYRRAESRIRLSRRSEQGGVLGSDVRAAESAEALLSTHRPQSEKVVDQGPLPPAAVLPPAKYLPETSDQTGRRRLGHVLVGRCFLLGNKEAQL